MMIQSADDTDSTVDDARSQCLDQSLLVSRRSLLRASSAIGWWIIANDNQAAHAIFDGGIGGLGKTRPETGVVFVNPDAPAEQTASGIVSAELVLDDTTGDVALVSFQSPWPLLATATGLEARDLVTSDAAFCQVVPGSLASASTSKEAAAILKQILQESVLASQGKSTFSILVVFVGVVAFLVSNFFLVLIRV